MMIIVGTLWIISSILDYAFFTYYAQLKEYRFDRFKEFVSTPAGKDFLFNYRILWRAIFTIVLFVLLDGVIRNIYIVFIVLCLDMVPKIYYVWKKNLRRPVATKKAVSIIAIGLAFELYIFWFVGLANILLLIFVLRFITVATLVIALSLPTTLLKRVYIHKAIKKMTRYKKLIVVGITGSYGKSSTKEFLSQILSTRYAVIKTPKNINTEIGIAKFILDTDFNDMDIFVVEMGAYRIGEIKKVCDIVRPTIGIITAIAQQHLALFGSMENIQQGKYELFRSLPKGGIAITNVDNKYCRELLNTLECRIKTFGSDPDFNPDVLIQNVENTNFGISYTVLSDKKVHNINLPIFGRHNVFNIIPATIVANEIGMKNDDINESIPHLKPGHGSIKLLSYGKSTILDDSYNSNPEGFKAALDLFNIFPSTKKRIVITRGMRELGEQEEELHEQIGGEISFVADELIITERDYAESLSRGVVKKFNTEVRCIYSLEKLLELIRSLKNTDSVILIENRVHSVIQKELGI